MKPLTTEVILTSSRLSSSTRPLRLWVSRELNLRFPLPPAQPPEEVQPGPLSSPLDNRQTSQHEQCAFHRGTYPVACGTHHTESISFLVHKNSTAGIILGRPWLVQHDPDLSWTTGEVLKWGDSCFPGCFPHLPQPVIPLPVHSTSIESPVEQQSIKIPPCYAPFSDVFCTKRASLLPPHRPWDCAIDLLPD